MLYFGDNVVMILFKNTIIYGLGSVLSKSIGIILLPILTRYLTPFDYGVIGILMIVSVFFNSLISLGFGTSIGIVYFENKDYDKRLEVIYSSFWVLLFVSLIFSFFSLFFIKDISYITLGQEKYWIETVLVIVASVISTVSMPLLLNIQFLERPTHFVAGNVSISIMSFVLNLLLVVLFKRGLKGYFEAFLLTQLLTFLVFAFLNKFNFRFVFKKETVKNLLKNGMPMMPSFFSLFILSQGNRYILRCFTNLDNVGIYTVGYNIGYITQIIINAFQSAWTPYFLSFYDRQDEAYEHFGKIVKYFILIMGFICIVFFIFSKLFVMMFISKQYIESYKIIGFIALSNLFFGLFNLLLPPMYFEKEVKYLSFIQGITAVLSIVINLIFIINFKEAGASIAFCLGYFIMSFLTWLFNKYKSKSKLKNYKVDKNIRKIVLVFFLFIPVSYFPRKFDLIGEIFFSIFLFCILAFITYVILDADEKKKLRNISLNIGFVRS